MGKAIGPTFGDEIAADPAITDLRFGWDAEGNFTFPDDFPKEVHDAVMAAYDRHDPNAPPPPKGPSLEDRVAKLEQQVAKILAG